MLSRSVRNGGDWHYNVVSDTSGNVAQLVRQDTGLVVANYRYTAYGLLQSRGIDASVTADPTDLAQVSDNSLLYQSKWQHKPSGLVNFGFRFYNPGTYSWINRDPLGESGGINLYSYVGGMPHNAFDPDGQNPVVLGVLAGIAVYEFLSPRPANAPGINSPIYSRQERGLPFDFMGEPQITTPWHMTYFGPSHFGYPDYRKKSYQFHEGVHRTQSAIDLTFNKSWAEIQAYQKQLKELKHQYGKPPAMGSPEQFFMEGEYLMMQANEKEWSQTLIHRKKAAININS